MNLDFLNHIKKIRKVIIDNNTIEIIMFDKKPVKFDYINDGSNIYMYYLYIDDNKKEIILSDLIIHIYKCMIDSLCNIKYIPSNIYTKNTQTSVNKSQLSKHDTIHDQTLIDLLTQNKKMSIIICDGLTYGINAGSILRDANAFGFDAVFYCPPLIDEHVKVNLIDTIKNNKLSHLYINNGKLTYNNSFTHDTLRYSMITDNGLNCKLYFNYDIGDIIDMLISMDYNVHILENDNCDLKLHDTRLSYDKYAFIVGNETIGISKYLRNRYLNEQSKIQLLSIETRNCSSLNVSHATSITMHKRYTDTIN